MQIHQWKILLEEDFSPTVLKMAAHEEKTPVDYELLLSMAHLKEEGEPITTENIFLCSKLKEVLVRYMEIINAVDKEKSVI